MSSQCLIFLASPKPTLMSEVDQSDPKFGKVWLVGLRYTYHPPIVLGTFSPGAGTHKKVFVQPADYL